MELELLNFHTPELYGDYWFNGEPVSLRDLRGQVVLVNFWDYTSLPCIHSLAYVKEWEEKYKEFDLVVVGVHTPQFKFAKSVEVMQRAVDVAGIRHPVVLDNEALLWSAFGARSWPTKFLVDKDGYVRYALQGESGYQQFERALQQLIIQSGFHGRLPDLSKPLHASDVSGSFLHKATGELFLGYLKSALGNANGYNPESTIDYVDPELYLPERFYASGKWLSTRECFSFSGQESEIGSIILQYEANDVNAVMNCGASEVCEVTVKQDGLSLSREFWGDDIGKGSQGASIALVDSPKLYNLVKNKEFGKHKLTLTTSSPSLEIYSFAFTTSVISDLIRTN